MDIHRAVIENDISFIRSFLDEGGNIEIPEPNSSLTPLCIAAQEINHELVKYLLSRGADPDGCDNGHADTTAVIHAASIGDLSMLRDLLDAGGSVNSVYGNISPLVGVVSCRSTVPVLKELISRGADVNYTDYFGNTALHEAFQFRQPQIEIIRELLDSGANIIALNSKGMLPIHYAVLKSNPRYLKNIRELYERGGYPQGNGKPLEEIYLDIHREALLLDQVPYNYNVTDEI